MPVQVRGHVAAFLRIDDDLPGRARIAGQHLGPIHRAESGADKVATREDMGHDVVGIGPDAVVRIIAELVVRHGEGVTGVGASGVRRGRDGDALMVRRRRR